MPYSRQVQIHPDIFQPLANIVDTLHNIIERVRLCKLPWKCISDKNGNCNNVLVLVSAFSF